MSYLEDSFPGLRSTEYRITSPSDPTYNCIAWAAGDESRWWEPDAFRQYYWPEGTPREYTLRAYAGAYAQLGFEVCNSGDANPLDLKVALFARPHDEPTHAARQLSSGRWTSKLGKDVDMEHDLTALKGEQYGRVAILMKRGRST